VINHPIQVIGLRFSDTKRRLSDDNLPSSRPGKLYAKGSRLAGKPWNGKEPIVANNRYFRNIGFKDQEAFFRYRESDS
jgi:hypothetical protein